nr:hypothetical protein [Tanacetum cinerariifolium]
MQRLTFLLFVIFIWCVDASPLVSNASSLTLFSMITGDHLSRSGKNVANGGLVAGGQNQMDCDMQIGEQNKELGKLDKKIMRPKLEMQADEKQRWWYLRADVVRNMVVSRKGVHPISAEKTKEAVLLIFECSQIRALKASSQKEKL